MNQTVVRDRSLLVLLVLVTAAFIWILLPFYGAVFWGSVLAILFAPFYRKLLVKMNQRRNMWWYKGEAKVDGAVVCEAEVSAMLVT